jgi:aminopeptidase YwaD
VQASPYSPGTCVTAPLVVADSITDLESQDLDGKILLMHGGLTREQYLPKNFPFFQVDEQQRVIHLLEQKKPLAVITATGRNPDMAGAMHPFPAFEDGDFDIPSVFMTEELGDRLARYTGREISLQIQARRIPARACNVIARKGENQKNRVVLFAHIDAKLGTPGALDNGTGIATLLLLGELLKDYKGSISIEIVALNGEDYYSNPGEQLYIKQNEGRFDQIALGLNIDGLGYSDGKTAYSLYGCPPQLTSVIESVFEQEETFLTGEPWFQGDHAIFMMNQRPALALTSERVDELMTKIVHTERDTPANVDPDKVARAAEALSHILQRLERSLA